MASLAPRKPGWRSALHLEIERHRREPFSWEAGTDCAMFAADCVKAMTGTDPAEAFRGRYRSAEGALRAVKRAGFSDLAGLAASVAEEVHPAKARVGDVALVRTDDALGYSLGIFIGELVAVRHPSGIGSVNRATCTKAFRIP
jgi:hypothetical protein